MSHDYDVWPYRPTEKPKGHTLYEMITHAHHQGLKEFEYFEDGKKIKVKLDWISPRPPEMIYGERWI
jgi:hypothetical protein